MKESLNNFLQHIVTSTAVFAVIAALSCMHGCDPADKRDPRLFPTGSVDRLAPVTSPSAHWLPTVNDGDWPMFGRNNNRTADSPLDFPSPDFVLAWKYRLSEHTFKYRQGTNLWSTSPVAAEIAGRTRLFIGAYDHKVYCFDAVDGKRLWRYTIGEEITAAPVLASIGRKPVLIVAGCDRTIYGLNPLNGRKIWNRGLLSWSYTVSPGVFGSPAHLETENGDFSALGYFINDAGAGRRIQEGGCALVKTDDGSVAWRLKLTSTKVFGPAVGVVKKRPILFFATADGIVRAIDARSGRVAWQFYTDEFMRGCPTFLRLPGKSLILVGSRWGIVRALDACTGKEIWRYKTGTTTWGSFAVGTVRDGRPTAFIGSSDRSLHAVDCNTGKRLWRFSTRNEILCSPAVARVAGKTVVFFSSMDDHLFCLDGLSGRLLWSFHFGRLPWPFTRRFDAVFSSPIVLRASGRPLLVFPAHDEVIYAFRSKEDARSGGAH